MNNDLITIVERDGQQLVDARELHEFLEIQKDFSGWIRYKIESLDLIENEDFCSLILGSEKIGRGGHNKKDYTITIETAKHILMASRTEKGKQVRKYFIEVEKAFRNQPKKELTTEELLSLTANRLSKSTDIAYTNRLEELEFNIEKIGRSLLIGTKKAPSLN